MEKSKRKQIEKSLIEISLRIARQGKGCLFVILEKEIECEPLIEQDIKPFKIFGNERRTELLAMHDGACLIDLDGNLTAYGVKISNTKAMKGFGTRHSAGLTASLTGNTVILSSEEDRKVKIFKKGKLVIQIDSLERKIEKKSDDIVNFLEGIGFGTIGAIGTSTLFPTLGITLIPGVILFGSSYLLIKYLKERN